MGVPAPVRRAERHKSQLLEPDPDCAGGGNWDDSRFLCSRRITSGGDDLKQFSAQNLWNVFERVRAQNVRVHCLTNSVAQNITANVMLACNITPSMTSSLDEIPEFIHSVSGLLINLGTLDGARRDVVRTAIDVMRDAPMPVVLDPVKVDRSSLRLQFAGEVLNAGASILKANLTEYEALKKHLPEKTLVARTGAEDEVLGAEHMIVVRNGHQLMDRVTAVGCALGGVMAGFAAVEPDQELAIAAALAVYGVSGEIAAEQAQGPGSFAPEFLDSLYTLSADQFEARVKFEIVLITHRGMAV